MLSTASENENQLTKKREECAGSCHCKAQEWILVWAHLGAQLVTSGNSLVPLVSQGLWVPYAAKVTPAVLGPQISAEYPSRQVDPSPGCVAPCSCLDKPLTERLTYVSLKLNHPTLWAKSVCFQESREHIWQGGVDARPPKPRGPPQTTVGTIHSNSQELQSDTLLSIKGRLPHQNHPELGL